MAWETAATQERQLLPRFRRVLGFGDVLDESISLYRQHWLTYAIVGAFCLIPPALVAIAFGAGGSFDTRQILADVQGGRTPSGASLAPLVTGLLVSGVVWALFLLAWSVALLITTDGYLHGIEPRFDYVFARTLRAYVPTLLGALLIFVGVVLLTIISSLLLVLTYVKPPIGVLVMLVALIGLLVWWLRPSARTTWLMWLIVVATPLGLAAYVFGLWSMFIAAIVLEGRWPFGALKRSVQLVSGQWMRVVTILTLASVIVSVLRYAPSLLVQLPLTVSAASRGQPGLGPTELVVSTAASVVVQILISSLGAVVYVVLFVDLRNRREGTDLAERLKQLEAAPLAAVNE